MGTVTGNKPVETAERTPFASGSLREHILRGAIGISAILSAIRLGELDGPWWAMPAAIALGLGAVFAFRGCPVCWTVGLFETSWRAWQGMRGRATS